MVCVQRLCQLAVSAAAKGGKAGADLTSLRVNIWRPFDEMDFHWPSYREVLVVAGGIAVSNEIHHSSLRAAAA